MPPERTDLEIAELVSGFITAFDFSPQEQFSIGVALICSVAETALAAAPDHPANPFKGATISQTDTIGSALSILTQFQAAAGAVV